MQPRHDAGEMVLRTRTAELQMRSDDERSFDAVFSTEDEDSYGEVIDAGSWDLARYRRNPVVLWNHNLAARGLLGSSGPEAALPIGTAKNVRVANRQLRGTITLVTAKANPLADKVLAGVRERSIAGVSVGFHVGRKAREKRGGRDVDVLYDCTLAELSVVPVPANPQAVIERSMAMPGAAKTRPASTERLAYNLERYVRELNGSAKAPTTPGQRALDAWSEAEVERMYQEALAASEKARNRGAAQRGRANVEKQRLYVDEMNKKAGIR